MGESNSPFPIKLNHSGFHKPLQFASSLALNLEEKGIGEELGSSFPQPQQPPSSTLPFCQKG
jgi:hypothetical protein